MNAESYSWKVEHFLDGRDMDDSFFNELCVVYDDDWNFPEDSAYRFAAAYVIRVLGGSMGVNEAKYAVNIRELTAEDFYARRQEIMEALSESYFLSEEEKVFWDEQESLVRKPFEYQSTMGILHIWDSYKWTFVLCSLVIGVCLSNVFSGEKARRTDALIYSCKYGDGRLYFIKCFSGIVFSTVVGMLGLIASHIPIYMFCGIYNLDAQWQMILPFSPVAKEAGEMLLWYFLAYLSGCVMVGVLTMMVSLLSGHSVVAAGTIFSLLIADLILSVPTSLRSLSQLRGLTPLAVLDNQTVQDLRLVKVLGHYLIPIQTGILLYVGLMAAVLFISLYIYDWRRGRRYKH